MMDSKRDGKILIANEILSPKQSNPGFITKWWADLPLLWKGFNVVLIPVMALLCALGSIQSTSRMESEAEAWVDRTVTIRYHLRNALSEIVDAEASVRGFVISRDAKFLDVYESSRQAFPRNVNELSNLLSDNPEQSARLNEIIQLAGARFELLSSVVEIVKTKNDASILQRESELIVEGKALMDKLRPQVEAMDKEERGIQEIRDQKLKNARNLSTQIIAASTIFGLLGGVAAMVLFSRGIVGRVKKIQANAERLANELPLEPIHGGNDEIGKLGGRLEEASELLKSGRQALRDDAERLSAEVAERKHAEEALREAKHEADRANSAKSEFLSRMSHELRTPLNAILGFAQVLELDAKTDDDRESIEQILRAGRHLLELINEVLDISRIEAGRLSISKEPVEVRPILRECLQLIQPLAKQRYVDVAEDFEYVCDTHILADYQRLKQVVLNLLSNAVKYNRDGGRVTISCDGCGTSKLRINVRDSGHGMAPEDLQRLFNPFDRLHAERTTIEGTGLGLALSKRLVEVMGGQIGVESKLGEGSLFWVELPVAESPVKQLERFGQTDLAATSNGAGPQKTLLYIEDNLSNLRLIERIFENRPDIKLVAAMQGNLALDLAREHHPDLVLLDLNLPDISGNEVLRRLKGEIVTGDIPVVVVSADATPRQIERLKEAGASDYIVKPIDVKNFLSVVEKTLGPKEPGPVA